MKVRLNGRELRLGISHVRAGDRRGTRVWLAAADHTPIAEGVAMCSAADNFCKRTGRRLAVNRLLASLRLDGKVFAKEDRRAIFQAVCPEYRG